jgi:hypothetical protein
MQLSTIVPWGRTHAEYVSMFSLSEAELRQHILGVGDGPASFNAEGTLIGEHIISVDPIYAFDAASIKNRFEEIAPTIMSQVREQVVAFSWSFHGSPEGLFANRRAALERFLADYEKGKLSGRYLSTELPTLPFEDDSFDLALCSHLLFLYSDHLDENFHVASMLELCRVACEVRIFPLLTLERKVSPHLAIILEAARLRGFHAEVRRVDYEFQRGGNEMLLIRKV